MPASICGHRGASAYAPENTLEAFRLAQELGADGIELDVHLTRDNQVLVAHDERVDRVSNGSGLIVQMTLAELKKLAFNALHPQYEGAQAPTLREVYEWLAPTGMYVNVELKNGLIAYEGLEEKCLALAAEFGLEERVYYSSFNHHSMVRLKQLQPAAVCGLLYASVMVAPWQYARALGMDAIHPHYAELALVDDECAQAHAQGIRVNTWTVNDERSMQMALEAGADMLITNYPDRALALLNA